MRIRTQNLLVALRIAVKSYENQGMGESCFCAGLRGIIAAIERGENITVEEN